MQEGKSSSYTVLLKTTNDNLTRQAKVLSRIRAFEVSMLTEWTAYLQAIMGSDTITASTIHNQEAKHHFLQIGTLHKSSL